MHDYIELVAKCEEWIAKADNFGADDLANHISRCADAIEQLVKERDDEREAAICDIPHICQCEIQPKGE